MYGWSLEWQSHKVGSCSFNHRLSQFNHFLTTWQECMTGAGKKETQRRLSCLTKPSCNLDFPNCRGWSYFSLEDEISGAPEGSFQKFGRCLQCFSTVLRGSLFFLSQFFSHQWKHSDRGYSFMSQLDWLTGQWPKRQVLLSSLKLVPSPSSMSAVLLVWPHIELIQRTKAIEK